MYIIHVHSYKRCRNINLAVIGLKTFDVLLDFINADLDGIDTEVAEQRWMCCRGYIAAC